MQPTRAIPTAVFLAASLLLSGCFSGGDSTSAPTSDDTRIRLAMLLPPRSDLSPFSDDAFKLSRWSTAETLVVLDPAGDPQPALAESWTQVDPLTWTFKVRAGVTFHDGTALTAETVATALTAATTAAPKPRILDGVELTATASGETLTVTTAVADPLLPQRLSSPQLSILAPKAYLGSTVSPIGTGTGAFVLTEVNGSTSATLNRYDGYWGTPAKAAGIDVTFVPDGTARAAGLRTGESDIVEAVPVSQAGLLDPELISEVPMPRTNTLYLNTENGAFREAGLRAAVRDSIDRATLVSGVYENRADPAVGLLGPALPWTSERPARATTTPASAPDGAAITLATFTDRTELPEVAAVLQQQLEAAGFTVTQVVREYANIEADMLAGEFDAFILSRATVLDTGDPAAYLASDFSCEGSFNISQLCDQAVDAAVQKAAATPTGPDRRAAILQAEAAILATDAAIPLLHERVIQGDSTRVVDSAKDPRERTLITTDTRIQ